MTHGILHWSLIENYNWSIHSNTSIPHLSIFYLIPTGCTLRIDLFIVAPMLPWGRYRWQNFPPLSSSPLFQAIAVKHCFSCFPSQPRFSLCPRYDFPLIAWQIPKRGLPYLAIESPKVHTLVARGSEHPTPGQTLSTLNRLLRQAEIWLPNSPCLGHVAPKICTYWLILLKKIFKM
jgi:hypothetical protein